MFVVVHELPGRIRFRSDKPFGRDIALRLAEGLDALPGIEGVRVNPRTGSVLLLYAFPEALGAARRLLAQNPLSLPRVMEPETSGRNSRPRFAPLLP